MKEGDLVIASGVQGVFIKELLGMYYVKCGGEVVVFHKSEVKPFPKDAVVENVIEKYKERSAVGVTEYGTTLEENNTHDFLLELQTELMDATLYIQKLIQQRDEKTTND